MTNLKRSQVAYDNEIQLRAAALLELRRRKLRGLPVAIMPHTGESPAEHLSRLFPHIRIPNGRRHASLWGWAEALTPGTKPKARVEIWPRGGAKSTQAELIAVRCAITLQRRFVLYVSGTQEQADAHVGTIATLLERAGVERSLGAYGQSKGWTAQLLRTANGFNVLAVGLNGNIRGMKLDEIRPDLIILDDIDNREDTPHATAKRLRQITSGIIPAGSADCAVLFIQNLIHENSVIAQIADGRAEALLDRDVCQEPAVWDLAYEQYRDPGDDGVKYRITGGTPTWPEGQSLAVAEAQINEWGPWAFREESQHEKRRTGGLWNADRDINPYRVIMLPDLIRVVIGIDPSSSELGTGDEAGIIAVGMDARKHLYVLADNSLRGSPAEWASASIATFYAMRADGIIAEANNGGGMVRATLSVVKGAPPIKLIHASRGKLTRAEPIQRLSQEGRIHFLGHHNALEDELTTWRPGMPSPNRLDAFVWAATELIMGASAWTEEDMHKGFSQGRK